MIKTVKGAYDILPEDVYLWQYLEEKINNITNKYNYKEIRTPIFEHSEVFHRDSELSDMVLKETYNFKDKGNRNLTLRPEGTAGVIRSYVEHKKYATEDLYKVFYYGPMFRYERPQKGRYRQFHQFGCEAIGYKSPLLDAEIIKVAYDLMDEIGLNNVFVEINSLGDQKSRENYLKALVDYLTPLKDKLSNDSKDRLKRNPLRILDSKNKNDIELLKDAPKIEDYLTKESKEYFLETLNYLKLMNVNYKINHKLVRGLDYYGEVVFEFFADLENLGSQNALGGGGRYETLVNELGGPNTTAIGFSLGLDRLIIALKEHNKNLLDNKKDTDVFIITFGSKEKEYSINVINELRLNNFNVEYDYLNRSFRSQFKRALNNNAKYIVIIGEDEMNTNLLTLKNTKTEEEEKILLNDLINKLEKELR